MRAALACSVGLVGLFVTSDALAQDVPRGEVVWAYSYLQGNPPRQEDTFGGFAAFHANGWAVAIDDNLNRWFALELSLSDHYGPSADELAVRSLGPVLNYAPRFMFLGGPAISFARLPQVTLFAHALFGGVRGTGKGFLTEIACVETRPCDITRSETAFATALGAGIDLKLTRQVWIRPIQLDYVRANFTESAQNNVRVATGVVLAVGRR